MDHLNHLRYDYETQFHERDLQIASLVFMGLSEIGHDICNFCFIKNSDVRDCGDDLSRLPLASCRVPRFVLHVNQCAMYTRSLLYRLCLQFIFVYVVTVITFNSYMN